MKLHMTRDELQKKILADLHEAIPLLAAGKHEEAQKLLIGASASNQYLARLEKGVKPVRD